MVSGDGLFFLERVCSSELGVAYGGVGRHVNEVRLEDLQITLKVSTPDISPGR